METTPAAGTYIKCSGCSVRTHYVAADGSRHSLNARHRRLCRNRRDQTLGQKYRAWR